MKNVLLKDKKYSGRFVALKEFGNETVVAYGKDTNEALRKAKQKGFRDPVILFVPEKNMVHIY